MKKLLFLALLLPFLVSCHTMNAERVEAMVDGANVMASEYATISRDYRNVLFVLLEKQSTPESKAFVGEKLANLEQSQRLVLDLHPTFIRLIESSPLDEKTMLTLMDTASKIYLQIKDMLEE